MLPAMMSERARESSVSLLARYDCVVPPAAAIALVFAVLPPAKLMTWVRTLHEMLSLVKPAKRSPAASTASACVSQVSSPSVRRMTFTERQARSPIAAEVSGEVRVMPPGDAGGTHWLE
jgi:hypothetical protein